MTKKQWYIGETAHYVDMKTELIGAGFPRCCPGFRMSKIGVETC